MKELIKNSCKECVYYHEENNTCQSKKVATGGNGYINIFDRLFCKPCILERGKGTIHIHNKSKKEKEE